METLALAALTAALALPGARLELEALRPSVPAGCAVAAADAPKPVRASGDVALRLRGAGASGAACEGWAWARVRVHAPVLVTQRALAAGEPLEGAVATREVELTGARAFLDVLPAGATAARALRPGTPVEEVHLRVGPRPGEPIAVLVRLGALEVEQPGRAVACARGRACALLPSGRRVEGTFDAGRLLVESP